MKTSKSVRYRGYTLTITAHCHDTGEWAGSFVAVKDGSTMPPGGVSIAGLHDSSTLAEDHAERLGKQAVDAHIDGVSK